jgi:hypothetical protein
MKKERKKLRPHCGDSSCEQNLHCYHRAKKRASRSTFGVGAGATSERPVGSCQVCGQMLVDWKRVQRRDVNDLHHTFEALKTELIRHYEFHAKLTDQGINYARRKGRKGLRVRITKHLTNAVGSAAPFRDGFQTPYPDPADGKGMDIIFAAQHATATCCRKCVEVWHAIPQGRDLTAEEVEYLTDLVFEFILDRLPDLSEDGERVSPIKKPIVSSDE